LKLREEEGEIALTTPLYDNLNGEPHLEEKKERGEGPRSRTGRREVNRGETHIKEKNGAATNFPDQDPLGLLKRANLDSFENKA